MSADLRALAAPILAAHPAAHALALDFGQALVRVSTNSPALRERLSRYFRDFLAAPGVRGVSPQADIEVTAIEAGSPDLGLAYRPKPPDAGKAVVKEEFAELADGRVVRKRLTGMTFLFGGGFNLAVGPCLANDNQVVNFINNRFIECLVHGGCLLFHAAGVSLGNTGLAIAGFAGMGKSTLALHVMRLGADFVSNDRLMVRRDAGPEQHAHETGVRETMVRDATLGHRRSGPCSKGEGQDGPSGSSPVGGKSEKGRRPLSGHPRNALVMYGLAKMPRVNPGTIVHNEALAAMLTPTERERYLAMGQGELWRLEEKRDAFIDECFGPGRFRLKARMAGLALLNWRRGGGPLSVREIDLEQRPDLFPAFMKHVGLFFEADGPSLAQDFSPERYLELLRGCPVLELTGGVDFESAAHALRDFIASRATAG